jgi:DNA polymerase I-like protein with 3'-5' exonuclease and polymerase domains
MIPLHKKEEFKNKFISSENFLKLKDKKNYIVRLEKYNELFSKLCNINIDKLAYKSYLEVEKNETIISCIKSFRNNRRLSYDMFKTSTGRLVVDSGPQVLTLPSKNRSIIKSSFKEGKVLSIDFSALEPRICLKLNNKDTSGDVYEEISSLISFNADRSVIKRATISILYGASYSSLSHLNISLERCKEVYNVINEYFGLDNIVKDASYVDENDLRKNFFGRPLDNIKETRKHILVNNYVQSTAVDISLNYFYELVNILDEEFVKPLFILHDAIIFDVESDYVEELNRVVNKGYNDSQLGYFPLKVEEFNKK